MTLTVEQQKSYGRFKVLKEELKEVKELMSLGMNTAEKDYLERLEKEIKYSKKIKLCLHKGDNGNYQESITLSSIGIGYTYGDCYYSDRSHSLEMLRRNDIPELCRSIKANRHIWVKELKTIKTVEILDSYLDYMEKYGANIRGIDLSHEKEYEVDSMKVTFIRDDELMMKEIKFVVCGITDYNITIKNNRNEENNYRYDGSINLRDYDHFYLIDQNYDKFMEIIKDSKQELRKMREEKLIGLAESKLALQTLKENTVHYFLLKDL